VIAGLLGASLFLFVVPFALTRSVVPGLACAAALLLGAWFYLQHCINRRAAAFERQFVDALDLAARSLRAGHPLLGAFRLISEEIPDPVGTVFMEICQQQALGLSLDEALEGVAAKATNDDVRIFCTSVVIQLRSGGNLAHMMDRLAFVIRDRMRVSRKVRVLTAQTQLSKRLLLALPVVVFFAMHLVNAEYVRILYTTSKGQIILGIAVCGLVLGAWVMNRLCMLRY
jgi:tight adherence protein B